MGSALTALALSQVSSVAGLVQGALAGPPPSTSGPWRPPQWAAGSGVPIPVTLTGTDPASGQSTAYVFDAIIRAEHNSRLVITRIPVQTGAAITDNAYIEPPSLVIEIRMSDAMQSYTVGQFADNPSRSVSAYQTLVSLQAAINTVQVATRLNQYSNMMITDIRADDTKDTAYALKVIVTFQQILTAAQTLMGPGLPTNSDIPQSTQQTATGQVPTTPVPPAVQQQNNIENTDDNGF